MRGLSSTCSPLNSSRWFRRAPNSRGCLTRAASSSKSATTPFLGSAVRGREVEYGHLLEVSGGSDAHRQSHAAGPSVGRVLARCAPGEPMLTAATFAKETVTEAALDAGHSARVADANSGPTRTRTRRTPRTEPRFRLLLASSPFV